MKDQEDFKEEVKDQEDLAIEDKEIEVKAADMYQDKEAEDDSKTFKNPLKSKTTTKWQ